jgi:hypothetical protein
LTTTASNHPVVAVSEPLVHALGPVAGQLVTVDTLANVSAGRIDTSAAAATNIRIVAALVDVLTLVTDPQFSVAFGADTHEGADEVLAVVATRVGLGVTLVEVGTMPAVGGQLVTVGTDTAIRSWGVVTPEGALKRFLKRLFDSKTSSGCS